VIIDTYNNLAKIMRDERMAIYQRELLLDTVIQSTPVALNLTNNRDHIVYSNLAAKTLLNQKKNLEGMKFADIYQQMPQALMEATANKHDGLITEKLNDETIVYHLNYQTFTLNKQQHHLYLYKNLTADMSRKESDIWKQVIRLISHELNNSLAPISSLTNSAKKVIRSGENHNMLPDMLDTISRRSAHLHQFIEQYAHFARLPQPKKSAIKLRPFVQTIKQLCAVETVTRFEADTLFCDATQIEQVLINLIKNAKESGSALNKVLLNVYQLADQITFEVTDQGKGMTEPQLLQALLPFYTTKSQGTGVGLALCNEIVIAHGGKLKLENQKVGGLKVAFSLSLRPA
jgi:nitrogen fixation/metabolism regulation signal transduction histidine kinase